MSLYITNPEADRLARELASRTGETLTEAVVTALRERLARIREMTREERITRALEIAHHAASILGDSSTVIDDLYDDKGLPA